VGAQAHTLRRTFTARYTVLSKPAGSARGQGRTGGAPARAAQRAARHSRGECPGAWLRDCWCLCWCAFTAGSEQPARISAIIPAPALPHADAPVCLALQSYVRARALSLAGSSAVSDRLNLPPETVVKAFAEAIRVLPAHMSYRFSELDANEPQLQLVFKHDCLCGPITHHLYCTVGT